MDKSWRTVWQYSAKRARKDTRALEAQHKRALAAVEGVKTARKPRFVKQNKTGITAKRLVKTLRPLREVTIQIPGGQKITAQPENNPENQKILNRLGH